LFLLVGENRAGIGRHPQIFFRIVYSGACCRKTGAAVLGMPGLKKYFYKRVPFIYLAFFP